VLSKQFTKSSTCAAHSAEFELQDGGTSDSSEVYCLASLRVRDDPNIEVIPHRSLGVFAVLGGLWHLAVGLYPRAILKMHKMKKD
jgi:hypothetical protein